MVYGAEAVLLSELTFQSPRVQSYDENKDEEKRKTELDLAEEARCRAVLHNARYQQGLRRYHEKKIRPRELKIGDLVLRRIQTRLGRNKLSPGWEGPFRVTEVPRPGSTRLQDMDGQALPNAWNIEHLRRFYP